MLRRATMLVTASVTFANRVARQSKNSQRPSGDRTYPLVGVNSDVFGAVTKRSLQLLQTEKGASTHPAHLLSPRTSHLLWKFSEL